LNVPPIVITCSPRALNMFWQTFRKIYAIQDWKIGPLRTLDFPSLAVEPVEGLLAYILSTVSY
jgi:hypothetical protein